MLADPCTGQSRARSGPALGVNWCNRLVSAHARVPRSGFAVPIPPDTGAPFGSPLPLPLTAPVEYGFPSPHWLPLICRPPTDAGLRPIPLPHTGARSVQTVPRTASTPETVRADSSRPWSDAESLDRLPDR